MAEEAKKTSNIYWTVAGSLVVGFGIAVLVFKFQKGKANKNVMATLNAKAEVQKIVKQAEPKDPNTEAVVKEDKVETGQLRTDGFTGSTQDVAEPLYVKVEKPQPKQEVHQNDTGVKLPSNAFSGAMNDGYGFEKGDVIYSLGNQSGKLARAVAGNFVLVDKSGNDMGDFKSTDTQKLGVIKSKEVNGVYFGMSPDYKRSGFIEYQKIYKLT